MSRVPILVGMYCLETKGTHHVCLRVLNSVNDASCFMRIKKRIKKICVKILSYAVGNAKSTV